MSSAATFSRSARAHRTITSAIALKAGVQLQDLTESEILGQYIPLGSSLLWGPCGSLLRALEPAAQHIPELQHAVTCFTSSNGSFLAVHLLNDSILVINIPSMLADIATAPAGVFSKPEANRKRDWRKVFDLPSHLAIALKAVHVSDCGSHLCVVTNFNAIYLFSPTSPEKVPQTSNWRQLPCPSAIPHAPIGTHVVFHSQHIQTVYISCAADGANNVTDGQEAFSQGVVSLQILSVAIHLSSFTIETVFFHEYQVNQDQPPPLGIVHPTISSSAPPTRLLGSIPIQFSLSPDSSNALAIHIQQTTRSSRKRSAAEAVTLGSPSPSASVSPTDWIVILHNWNSSIASYGNLVSTRRLYELHPESANDSTPLTTPNESEGDVVAAIAWVPVPKTCILAVLSCSGKLAWITPAGRISRSTLAVPEINAAWQLGDQDLHALSKLTLRRLNPHESLIASVPVLRPRLFNQAAQSGQQARAQSCYSLCAAVARVPSGADGQVRMDPVLLVCDGRVMVSVQVPFDLATDAGGKSLKVDAFKSVANVAPSLSKLRQGSSQYLNQQVTMLSRLRTFLDAVFLDQCPWIMDPLLPEEEDEAVSGNLTSYQLDISPAWSKDTRFGAIVKRLIDSVIGTAEEFMETASISASAARPAARGFVRRGITQTLSSATRTTINVDILLDTVHLILAATFSRHHLITGIGIAGRLAVQLVERGQPECAVQVVHYVCHWLKDDTVQAWTMGWRVMEEALLKCDDAEAHAILSECVRMFAPTCVASQMAGDTCGFDNMRTDGIPLEVVQFVDQESEIQFADGAIGLQSSLRYALASGQWGKALDIFQQSCAFETVFAGDADALEQLQSEWVNFAAQVVNAFSATKPSEMVKTVLISSPIDPERKQHADMASLCSYIQSNPSHFCPHQVFVQAASTRNSQVLNGLVQHAADHGNNQPLGPWHQAWPNLLLFSLVSAFLSNSPDQAYLQTASLVDDLLSWALSSDQVHVARFVAQMTTSLTQPAISGADTLLEAIGGVHQYYLRSVLAHIMLDIQSSLPLRLFGPVALDVSNDGGWGGLTCYPGIGHLLQQTIFEGDSEKWPEEVSVTLVPLIGWIKCALQLAAAVASVQTSSDSEPYVPLLPIFKVLRICYALELRAEILKALAQHAGDNPIKSIVKTSVAWMEKVLLLLHFDDVFGEAAVVRFAAAVLRESVPGIKGANNSRQSQEAISAVVLTLDQLVTPRVASMAILAACSDTAYPLRSSDHQHRGKGAKLKDEWSFWPSEMPVDPQTPLTPAAFAHMTDFPSVHGSGNPTQLGTTARVTNLLADIRFRRFCETLLPVIEEHVLQPPPPAATRSLYDKATFYWQPSFPPLVPRQALLWAFNESEEDGLLVRPPTRGDHAASCELGEFDTPSPSPTAEVGYTTAPTLQVEDFDVDPVAEFHGNGGTISALRDTSVPDGGANEVDLFTDTSELVPIREERGPRTEGARGGKVKNLDEASWRNRSPKRKKNKNKSVNSNNLRSIKQVEACPSFIPASSDSDPNDIIQNHDQKSPETNANVIEPGPHDSPPPIPSEADRQTKELIVNLSTAVGTLVSELHGFVVAMSEAQKNKQEPAGAPTLPSTEFHHPAPVTVEAPKPPKERKKKRRKPINVELKSTTAPESTPATAGMKKSPSFELFVRERTLAESRKFRTNAVQEPDKRVYISRTGTVKYRDSPAKLWYTANPGLLQATRHIEGKLPTLHRPTVKLTSIMNMR